MNIDIVIGFVSARFTLFYKREDWSCRVLIGTGIKFRKATRHWQFVVIRDGFRVGFRGLSA